MERDCESELSKLNIEQNACIYHFGASVIHGQRSNILRLRLTDLYSRFAVSLEDNEWKEFLCISDFLEDTDTGVEEMLRDIFSPYTGVLQNTEVRNAAECLDLLEIKYTSGVGKNLANRMGITLIDIYRLAGSAAAAPNRQWILCERIFMELLHYMGQIVDESAPI